MSQSDIDAIEEKINELIKRCYTLEQENSDLKKRELELREERARLMQINDQTRTKVEAMIQRLKSLEQNS